MKSLAKTLLVIYLLILLWLLLFKFTSDLSSISDHARSITLIPFADSSRGVLRDAAYNFAIFIPFGMLLSVNLKRASFRQKLACILAFSLTVEIIQFIFAIGATDITDILTNTSGGLLGLALYSTSHKRVGGEKLDQFIVVLGMILILMFVLLAGVLLSHGVRYKSAH